MSGYVAWWFGLSLALGAFVAGLVINESEYAHQALSDVMPLRDLFGMLFFVSVGMLLDPALVWQHSARSRSSSPSWSPARRLILAAVVRAFRLPTRRAVGRRPHAFSGRRVCVRAGPRRPRERRDLERTVHAHAEHRRRDDGADAGGVWPHAVSLRAVRRRRVADTLEAINIPQSGLSDHVIIAGGGRVGRSIADALSHMRSAVCADRVRRPPSETGARGRAYR